MTGICNYLEKNILGHILLQFSIAKWRHLMCFRNTLCLFLWITDNWQFRLCKIWRRKTHQSKNYGKKASTLQSVSWTYLLSPKIQGLLFKSSIKYHFLLAFLLPTFSRLPHTRISSFLLYIAKYSSDLSLYLRRHNLSHPQKYWENLGPDDVYQSTNFLTCDINQGIWIVLAASNHSSLPDVRQDIHITISNSSNQHQNILYLPRWFWMSHRNFQGLQVSIFIL